tara:strand:+ start:13765 stop:14268 length:504 start_codon:yes stop_codon:yes gene_type:complete
MIKKNQIFTLDKLEQKIVYTIANERQINKEKTGWNGYRTVAKKNDVNLNLVGFGAEFIFCRELNLFPDFTILNTSKTLGTDKYDCIYKNFTVDVKVNRNVNNPLMIPEYAKTNCKLFALFVCKFPKYRFEGFATNKMIFQKNNLRMTRVQSYVLNKKYLLDFDELNL